MLGFQFVRNENLGWFCPDRLICFEVSRKKTHDEITLKVFQMVKFIQMQNKLKAKSSFHQQIFAFSWYVSMASESTDVFLRIKFAFTEKKTKDATEIIETCYRPKNLRI